jgi:hypothetical protein
LPVAAPAPVPDAAVGAEDDPEPGRTGDPRAFGTLTFERTYLKDDGDMRDSYVSKTVRAAVKTCFDNIPHDQRSPNHVYKVVIEWANDSYERKVPPRSGVGFGYRGDAIGGGGDYPPSIDHAGFTACVTAAVPEERVSSMDADRAKTRAIRFRVYAYTEGAVGRYLTGAVGHGQGRP